MTSPHLRRAALMASVSCWAVLFATQTSAQRAPQPAADNPRAAAPVDITGYWVSVVSEDWLQRMLMPPRGDYAGVPLNPEGRRVANLWDPDKQALDGCRPFGAPAIMRVPGRLHITWENEDTLKIDADAGLQTRLLHFDTQPAGRSLKASWQGYSVASWDLLQPRGGTGAGLAPPAPRVGGALKVVTTNLRDGYLRRNGVPYSANAALTEYFDRLTEEGTDWLTVVTIVNDPKYLSQEFVTSTHFKRETDGSKWMPRACDDPSFIEARNSTDTRPRGPNPTAGQESTLIGGWSLDLFKSTYSAGDPPIRRTVTFEAAGDGVKQITETTRQGFNISETTRVEYTAQFDGKDYPIPNSDGATVALKRVNATTVERIGKLNGKQNETTTMRLSNGGQTLTITTKGTANNGTDYSRTEVFNRQ
jgi:hypothetical protein